MGAAARNRVERYFTWDRHARLLDRAVRSAVGEAIELKDPIEVPVDRANTVGPLHLPQAPELAKVETGPLAKAYQD